MRQHGVMGLAELVSLVGADVITEAEAARRAKTADWLWDDDQILGGVEAAINASNNGRRDFAGVFAALLMDVVEQVRPELWPLTATTFVRIATEVVAAGLDGGLYKQASDVAARLIPHADGHTLLAIGELKLEPYATDPITGTFTERMRAHRARMRRRSFDWTDEPGMPPLEQALGEAAEHFAAAGNALTGFERGYALVHQAYAAFSNPDADRDQCLVLCQEAWPLLQDEPLSTARACWILAQRDALGQVAGRPMVVPPVDRLLKGYGPRRTAATAAIGLVLFSQHDRGFARRLSEQVHAGLPPVGYEQHRQWFARFPTHVLPNDPTDCATAAAAGSLPTLALRDDWTDAQVHDATLHAAAHDKLGGWTNLADEALSSQVKADRHERVGGTLMSAGDNATAVSHVLLAAVEHTLNGHVEAAETCLHLATAAVTDCQDAVCVAMPDLVRCADLLAAGIGEPGVRALDELYRACFFQLHQPGRPFPLSALMQLAKGRAFARWQSGPPPPQPDADADALSSGADMASAEPEEFLDAASGLFDGDAFLGAYLLDGEMQPGSTPAEELANRRRAYQRQETRRLVTHAGPAQVMADHEVRATLSPDTVVVSIYEGGVLSPPQPGIVFMIDTAERSWSVTVVHQGTEPQLEVLLGIPDGRSMRRIRYTPGAIHTAHLRRLILEDPLHRVVSREAEETLGHEAIHFEALLDQLARLHKEGKRHLVIWPHGVYYFFPFHLLPTGHGRIIADDWTVTLIPSFWSLTGESRVDTQSRLLAMASPSGGVPYGLTAQPAVTDQARAVAAMFGATPLLDAAATKQRFLAEAEHARFVHLAAHGAQYSPAPLFDRIYLADAPLYAHEVLRLDLRGVELVTLSACESALLRFDLSDNLHGMAAAFLRAGAGAVVGALWPVRAEVAGVFYAELYDQLAQGVSKLAAFREAQSATRRSHPQHRDWAAFSLLGDCWER